jgi:hypothetical protein
MLISISFLMDEFNIFVLIIFINSIDFSFMFIEFLFDGSETGKELKI